MDCRDVAPGSFLMQQVTPRGIKKTSALDRTAAAGFFIYLHAADHFPGLDGGFYQFVNFL